jgi:tetratricopeptide (TPR) repeat protein
MVNKQVNIEMLILSFLLLWAVSCTSSVKEEKIPATSDSEWARLLYHKADTLFEKVYISEAVAHLEEALAEDPDFFMAAYGLATHYMFFEDNRDFQKYAAQAIQSENKLSKGENLLKAALQKLLEDQHADVTEFGKELVKLYPNDPYAYFHLTFFQQITGDYQGQVKTLLKAAEIKEDPANILNTLGYTYMSLEQFDEAAKALDKYIELKPDDPNPYDSKGDYYMAVEEYGKAYDSFMKAVEIDSTWTGSLRKARRARAMIKTGAAEYIP